MGPGRAGRAGSAPGCAGSAAGARRSARLHGAGRAAGMLAPLLGSAGSGWLLLGECSPQKPPRPLGFVPFLRPLPIAPRSVFPGSFPAAAGKCRVGPFGKDLRAPVPAPGPLSGSPPSPPRLRSKGYFQCFEGKKAGGSAHIMAKLGTCEPTAGTMRCHCSAIRRTRLNALHNFPQIITPGRSVGPSSADW